MPVTIRMAAAGVVAPSEVAPSSTDTDHTLAELLADDTKWDPEAVLARVAAYPEEAAIADDKEELPVHKKRVLRDSRVLAGVLAAHPAGARVLNPSGDTPLHLAIRLSAPAESVALLLEAAPEAASVSTFLDKHLPVHKISAATPLEVVRLLIRAHPASACAVNSSGDTALHRAVANNAPVELVALLLEAAPEAAAVAGQGKCLPVHKITATTPLEVVRLLIRAHPAGARGVNSDGNTALHLAVENNAPVELVALVLEAAPEAAATVGGEATLLHVGKCLPVHNISAATPLEVVRLLIRAHPVGARAATSNGETALHLAVANNVSAEAVALLLDAAPEAAAIAGRGMCLPVHKISAGTPLEVVRLLIRAHPAGLAQTTAAKELPLHLVAECACPEVVRAVAAAFPAAVRVPFPRDTRSFIKRALAKVGTDMVAWVLNAHMAMLLPALIQRRGMIRGTSDGSANSRAEAQAQVQLRDEDGGAAAADVNAWIELVQHGRDAYVHVVEAFLDAHAPHVAALASATDSFGRKALDLATPGVKRALLARLHLLGRYSVSWPPEHASATSLVYRGLDLFDEGEAEAGGEGKGGDGTNGGAGAALPLSAHSKRALLTLLVHPRPVVLKFMRTRAEFERERDVRALLERADAAAAAAAATPVDAGGTRGSLAPARARAADAVVPLLRCHDAACDADFARQVAAQPYDTHPHLLVMAAGERSLAVIIDAERAAPRWQAECVRATREVAEALAALHDAGVVHGDVKARNVLRVSGGAYKLIDLDAAAPFSGYVGAKLSTAVAAPELLAARARARARSSTASDAVAAAAAAASSGDGGDGIEGHDPGLIPASPAVDMWGLGALLFHMLRGATLVHADAADNAVSPADEAAMAAWDDDARRTALAGIADAHARHLLAQLLAPDPARRPSAAAVLSHPFLTGRAAARLPGDAPEHDVFISYRVASEAALARELHARLSQAGLRVWLDAVCLVDGRRWLDGFCEGLARSRVCMPLLSVGGIGSWASLTPESPCDNVLLEHRLALELRARGLLDAIFPVFVGPPLPAAATGAEGGGGSGAAAASSGTDVVRGSLFEAMRSGAMAPPADVVVAAVEGTLRAQLDDVLGLGVPLRDAASAAAVWKEVCAFQGAQLSGEHVPAVDALVRRVAAAVASERAR